jgi:murein DD-endopeptidase MepM/ murein hydrolase activator NlpD
VAHPILHFPSKPVVLDLTGNTPESKGHQYSIGRYNEVRNIYSQPLFGGERNIHMGIDLGAPAGTPVFSFAPCRIYSLGTNTGDGNYGPTLITEQIVNGEKFWALYGHLSASSILGKQPGQSLQEGSVIGWLGETSENGGWPPHVHFQLSRKQPDGFDMPGAISAANRTQSLHDYPDPRTVLGPLY